MSFCSVGRTKNVSALALLISLAAMFCAPASVAQQQDNPPKVEVFGGYQWYSPNTTVPDLLGNPLKLPSAPKGWGSAITYNFDKHFGLTADFGGNYSSPANTYTATIGPRFMWRTQGLNLFAQTLLGGNFLKVSGFDTKNGIGAVLGGGVDLPIGKRFSWRMLEADYVWSHQNFSDVAGLTDSKLRRPSIDGVRLRSGIVFNFGGAPEIPPAASCSVQPSEVMVGEPVTVTVNPSNFKLGHSVTYTYSATGGKVTGKDSSATVDTTGLSGGSYTVNAHVADAKLKKNNEASCNATFSVKEPPKNPPTMSCSANPATVQTGTPSTISCECKSPDGVPVTVSNWTASLGQLSGSGNSATLNTTGANGGTSSISATCTDSRGLSTNASTSVTVENPPPPVNPEIAVLEAKLALHSVYFATAQPTKAKPNAGLVASQQETLTTLAADYQKYLVYKGNPNPAPHLILEGHADPRGSVAYNQALSERRVERAKSFLVEHGVPAEDIETRGLGKDHNLTDAEVRESVDQNTDLTPKERARIMKNERAIILASNRRVDVTLQGTGQTSVRRYPFNAADALTLIGGRESAMKKAPVAKKPAAKRPAAKKKK